MKPTLPLCLAVLLASAAPTSAQQVEELKNHYSGAIEWLPDAGTLRFLTSGRVNFVRPDFRSSIWEIPENVNRVELLRGVRVEAALTTKTSLSIVGQGPDQSEIYGTPTPQLLHDNGLDGSETIPGYSAVYAVGRDVVINISNLRSRNPLGFHFLGMHGAVLHLYRVSAIDDRGGAYNHSDGVSGSKGSTVSNSYFETGDDVIKIYSDITVTDTEIRMIRNAVPFQFGWGSYGDGAHAVLRSIRITGDSGRNNDFPIFNAQAGVYAKTVDADGLVIDQPRATLFRFNDPNARIDITIRNSQINAGKYGDHADAAGTRTISESHVHFANP